MGLPLCVRYLPLPHDADRPGRGRRKALACVQHSTSLFGGVLPTAGAGRWRRRCLSKPEPGAPFMVLPSRARAPLRADSRRTERLPEMTAELVSDQRPHRACRRGRRGFAGAARRLYRRHRRRAPARAGEDMGGDYIIPGLVELHTDHLEGHYAPRPKVRWNPLAAVLAHDAQVATAGITTVLRRPARRHGRRRRPDIGRHAQAGRRDRGQRQQTVCAPTISSICAARFRRRTASRAFAYFDGDERVSWRR